MRAELSKSQGWGYSLKQNYNIHVLDAASSLGIILGPDPHVLVQMMWAENWPITSQIVKVVHDDSDEQVNDLKRQKRDCCAERKRNLVVWQITRSANKKYSHKNDLKLVEIKKQINLPTLGNFYYMRNGNWKSIYHTLIILIPYLTTIQLDHGSLVNDWLLRYNAEMMDLARIDKVCTGRLFSNLVPRVLSYT